MTWALHFSKIAIKQLGKLSSNQAAIITGWLRRNIEGCEDPRSHGKPLSVNLKGAWRYRVGDYRILCELKDSELVVLTLEVRHRREAYKH